MTVDGKIIWLLGAVITGMFTIILGMTAYIMTTLGNTTDTITMRIEGEAHRIDRVADRENDIDRRLAVVEFKTEGKTPQ
jgi:hypothetical protein